MRFLPAFIIAAISAAAFAESPASPRPADRPARLTSMVASQPADEVRDSLNKLEQARLALWRENVKSFGDSRTASDLDKVVDQVRQAKLELKAAPAKTASPVVAQVVSLQPSKPAGMAETQPAVDEKVQLSRQALAELQKLPPEKITDPLALADALYQSAHVAESLRFYEIALSQQLSSDEQAWALLQCGNCKRQEDPAGAQQFYRRVISEHPDSTWRQVAEARQRLAEWDLINKPQAMIRQADLQTRQIEQATSQAFTMPTTTGTSQP